MFAVLLAIAMLGQVGEAEQEAPPAAADDVLERKKQAFLAAMEAYRASEIERLQTQLARLPRKHRSRKQLVAALRRARDPKTVALPPLSLGMEVGHVGRFTPNHSLSCEQVVSATEMLVEVRYSGTQTVMKSRRPGAAATIDNVYAATVPVTATKLVLLRGLPTKGIAADSPVDPGRYFLEVTGTETYDTVLGGTNTVFVLEPLDPQLVSQWLAEAKREKKQPAKQ